ncbi:MAG: hypothetical protein KH116_10605 [Clostridium sp.]|jgi:hypothetical protein|nr:hypothetical protein [Clostridium sp.]DAE51731.1 MAG TPA: hypothetical protein [Caudoviricetes sp.]
MKCTFKELTLENGEVIKLTLNFARLLQLKNKRKKDYEEYNNIYIKEDKDATFSAITILYTAYLCANIEHLDDNTLMSKEEFMENIPQSFVLISNLSNELANPKQKKISGMPLQKQQRR